MNFIKKVSAYNQNFDTERRKNSISTISLYNSVCMYSLCSTKWWTFFGDFFSHFISLMRGWGRKFISLSKEGLFSFLSDCQLVVLLTFFHNFCQVVQKFFFLMFFDDDRGILQNNFFCLKITFFCEKMISFSSREGEKCIFTKKRVYHFFLLCANNF